MRDAVWLGDMRRDEITSTKPIRYEIAKQDPPKASEWGTQNRLQRDRLRDEVLNRGDGRYNESQRRAAFSVVVRDPNSVGSSGSPAECLGMRQGEPTLDEDLEKNQTCEGRNVATWRRETRGKVSRRLPKTDQKRWVVC